MNTICPPGCVPIKSMNTKMKICPTDKIINPKTGRCVSKHGSIGLLLLNTKVPKVPKVPKDPLNYNLVNKGLSCKADNISSNDLFIKIGEVVDIYSVSKGIKDLAAMDFSSYGKNKLKKLNIGLINKVIDYCNCMGVQMLHNTTRGGMYLKTIFFLPHNYNKALKLMSVLWYKHANIPDYMIDVPIGLLLGYGIDNILYKIKQAKLDITKKDIVTIQSKLDKMTVSLEELQETYKIVHKTKIPNL